MLVEITRYIYFLFLKGQKFLCRDNDFGNIVFERSTFL